MKKSFILWIAMLTTCMAFAQVSTWDGTWEPWTHGTGTEADPFLIENAQQLAYLAYRVNNGLDAGGGHVSNHDLHYKLMVDVNLNGSETFQWTPIGYWNSDTDYQCFGGHFDGNNHAVSELYINNSSDMAGFFGYTEGVTLKNLIFSGTTITIANNNGVFGGANYVGGLIGCANGTTTIAHCSCSYTNGISAYRRYGTCYVGGIIGCSYGLITITDCQNAGDYEGRVSDWMYSYSGGIVGCVEEAIITCCYNTGNLTANTNGGGYSSCYSYSGGIVGRVLNAGATISNCYNVGEVSAICSGTGVRHACSGGIMGYGETISISNCYNVGGVTSININGGGIVGEGNNSVANCFFLNTSGHNTYGGQPMSADAMQSAEFVTILNAGSLTYKKDNQPYINQGYPIFSGFNIETRPASSIELTSAVLNGSYTSGIFNITSQGFEYKKTTDQNYTTVNCTAGQTPFSYEVNGLESGATYQYRAFAVANEGTAYGEVVGFTTETTNTYLIDAWVHGPGNITPEGLITVVEGEDFTFEITPILQSTLDSVLVDNENIGSVTSYTFHNVQGNHSIQACFTLTSTSDLNPWDGITINEPLYYNDRYYIVSPTELAWVAQETNNGNSFQGKKIFIMNDLDLGGMQPTPSIWTPIGTEQNPFKGNCYGYDGCKTINNLYCNNPGNNNVGLFGYVGGGVFIHQINRIQLFNVNIVGNSNVGGLVGYLRYGEVNNCGVFGSVKGNQNVGGLIGYVDEFPEYDWGYCYSLTNVEANENAGGLVGTIKEYNINNDITDHKKIVKCFSAGIVRSQGVSGGLIGCIDLGGDTFNDVYLKIKACYSNATVIGSQCGGLIGKRTMNAINNSYSGILSIDESYVSGCVKDGYGFIALDNNANEEVASCSNCFFDAQSTGCGNNGIPGVSSKKTSEMTTNISFGMTNSCWDYSYGLYPQIHLDNSMFDNDDLLNKVKDLSLLSVSPIFLQNNENSSSVHSNFQVSTTNGVTWSSSNLDVIAINGSYANVNPTINETVTLTATLNGISKQLNVTVADPNTILIYQPNELRHIAEQCNAGVTYEGMCIKLMNDIELPLNVPNNMISIGSYPDHPFKGTFDGNGKLITNLYIDQPNTPYQGFFGYTLNANLYNVGLVNITASGRNYTGGMVAYAANTHMRDCYVNGGTLFALSYCGGLVGYQDQGTNSIISGCYNTCEVTGNNYVGGLIGFSNYSTVRNSYVAGRVSAQGDAVGAIIGGANEVLMYYCYFSTEITGQTQAIGENNNGNGKDGGEGLTNAQMRDPQFVNTLNQNLVTPVWMADYATHINNGFPIIKWQRPSTGVEEHDAAKNPISLYPNPANGFVTIQSDDSDISLKLVEVYDVMGRKVMLKVLNGQSHGFSIEKLPAGMYNVRILTDNGCNTNLKLVVR